MTAMLFSYCSGLSQPISSHRLRREGGNLTSSSPSFRRIYVIHSVFFRVLLSHRSGDRTLTPASVRMSDMTGKSLSPSLNGSIFGAEREVRTSVL